LILWGDLFPCADGRRLVLSALLLGEALNQKQTVTALDDFTPSGLEPLEVRVKRNMLTLLICDARRSSLEGD
jgi:hypothetical protein